jgi:hypothetical protein
MYAASLHPTTSLLVDGMEGAIPLQLYTLTNTILGHITPLKCVHGTPPQLETASHMGVQSRSSQAHRLMSKGPRLESA